jgi:hypothetical protein
VLQPEDYAFITPAFSAIARTMFNDPAMPGRSARDAAIYREASPSVVLIFAGDSLGSGVIVSETQILTNWHVIAGQTRVGVVFKPEMEGATPQPEDMRKGIVVKWDDMADLALVEVLDMPEAHGPIPLGDADAIAVGLDVHAIGHPDGQQWTYTKGIISQYRIGYEWTYPGDDRAHRGNVIQTQTPINPGNSGGPLLDEDGALVGINSFGGGGEGLNFAVSIDEIEAFLAREGNREAERMVAETPASCDQPVILESSRSEDDIADIKVLDMDCNGTSDAAVWIPDDKNEPIEFMLDRDEDGNADAWLYDDGQNGSWELSFWDDDLDGEPELVGHHKNGDPSPAMFEAYDNWEQRMAAAE